jgi:hypothetical protein
VRLVEDRGAQVALCEQLEVGLEDLVVEDHDLRLADGGALLTGQRAAADDGHAPVRYPDAGLALPVELDARRADDDRGVGAVELERGQRLHGLAEPLLVGDERAPLAQRVRHAGALEGPQRAAERGRRRGQHGRGGGEHDLQGRGDSTASQLLAPAARANEVSQIHSRRP